MYRSNVAQTSLRGKCRFSRSSLQPPCKLFGETIHESYGLSLCAICEWSQLWYCQTRNRTNQIVQWLVLHGGIWGMANFRSVHFTKLTFLRTLFRNGADFHGTKGRRLQLLGVTITGPLAFDDAVIDGLELNGAGGS